MAVANYLFPLPRAHTPSLLLHFACWPVQRHFSSTWSSWKWPVPLDQFVLALSSGCVRAAYFPGQRAIRSRHLRSIWWMCCSPFAHALCEILCLSEHISPNSLLSMHRKHLIPEFNHLYILFAVPSISKWCHPAMGIAYLRGGPARK